jgi:hypothetical protein
VAVAVVAGIALAFAGATAASASSFTTAGQCHLGACGTCQCA